MTSVTDLFGSAYTNIHNAIEVHIMKKTILTVLLFIGLPAFLMGQQTNDDRVLLQGFYWNAQDVEAGWYNIIAQEAQSLSESGIDMIWLPPPSDAGAPQGYLPRELYNLNNEYGTESEHLAMLSALDANSIDAIADIVINHRVGSSNWIDFTNPTWGSWSITADDEVWGQPEYQSITNRGSYDTGTAYGPARDVDHTNPTVQQDILYWMNSILKNAGYDGWRYDFVHGFSTSYINQYNSGSSPSFSVGENWSDKQTIQNWIDGTGNSTAFDFPTYYALKSAIKDGNYGGLADNGQPAGGIGWDSQNYTTFVENHDTPRYDPNNNMLNSGNVVQAYAYLLTHPGVPTIYWPHYMDWGVRSEIDALIDVRKDNGLNSQSSVDIRAAQYDLYAAVIDGKVAVKLGGGNWNPSDAGLSGNWNLTTYGNDYAVWTEGTPEPEPGNGMTVYYHTDTYSQPTVYFWNLTSSSATTTWPGETMSLEGNGWYSYNFSNAESASLIFNDNGANQSEDLARSGDGWYKDGTWYNDNPDEGNNTGDLTLYYFNNGSFSSPTAYFWGNDGSATTTWPGETMASEGSGWFSVTISGATESNVIFSDNGSNQSPDLFRNGDGYYKDGTWSDNQPGTPTGLTVHYRNTTGWSSPTVYFWENDGSATTTWPGESMTSEGDGWFVYTVDDATQSNIIFSDNGNGQTADLFRASEGWFENGSWTDASSKKGGDDMGELEPESDQLPLTTQLKANYPNPFNPSTQIPFELSEQSEITLSVYSLLGNKVASLIQSRTMNTGNHVVTFSADNISSGIYIYRFEAIGAGGDVTIEKGKMTLIK